MLNQNQNNRLACLMYIGMAFVILLNCHLYHQAWYHHICYIILCWTGSQHHRVFFIPFRSCFLATPKTQIKDMFKKTRWVLTLLYLGSIIGTLVMAFLLPDNLKGLVILMLVVQIITYYLYTFSFVPFGRKILKKCC